ncbi:hypothetical protein ACQB6R_05765 [Propionibacteriaceae bacterium G1746]|uniref:hypothetical protein n=1 Tax=Aestuariimicrobium sp. G57 TaxID=3418485 RepID=UPI003C204378
MVTWADLDDAGSDDAADDGLERVGDPRVADDNPTPTGHDKSDDELPVDDYPDADRGPGETDYPDDLDVPEGEQWSKEMGFPDQDGVVRIWVDDSALIERVRLSLHWRNHLGDQPLEQSFAVCFMLINNYHRVAQRRTLDFFADGPEADQPLSWDALRGIRARQQEVQGQLDALGEGGQTELQGEPTLGSGAKGRVRLGLNLVGQLAGVHFDRQWLARARVKEIGDAVIEAHADARSRFVPAQVVVGERERLTNELSDLRDQTLALMRRGFF